MEMIYPIIILTILGIVLGLIIILADKKFYIPEDTRVKEITGLLPSANCGACGFAGCAAFAQALIAGKAKPSACIPGGAEMSAKIADFLGVDSVAGVAQTAKIHCKGGNKEAKERAVYDGINDCFAAVLVANGSKECEYGCLGHGSCVEACPFDALIINKNGVAQVIEEKCIGCGACVSACPRKLIEITPETQKIFVACNNHDKGARVKKYCSVGCTGCGICAKAVSVPDSIEMDNFLPKLDYETGENFIVPLHKCPSKSFTDLAKGRPIVNIDMKCNGCEKCVKICPVKGAIEGEKDKRHSINKKLCIGCGRCIAVCELKSIGIWGALAYDDGYRSSQNKSRIS
jgi:RnfABCDGE-type electron transport complex B subunit